MDRCALDVLTFLSASTPREVSLTGALRLAPPFSFFSLKTGAAAAAAAAARLVSCPSSEAKLARFVSYVSAPNVSYPLVCRRKARQQRGREILRDMFDRGAIPRRLNKPLIDTSDKQPVAPKPTEQMVKLAKLFRRSE